MTRKSKDHKIEVADVDAMLDRWRDIAGDDWQSAFRHRLNMHRDAFARRSDPLDAWASVLLARALNEAPPAWALDYLAVCAAGIHDLHVASAAGESIRPAMIGRALGMVSKGAGTAFPGPDEFVWVGYAVQVRDALPACGGKEYLALEAVAEENGVSKSTVHKAWKQFQVTCPELSSKKSATF